MMGLRIMMLSAFVTVAVSHAEPAIGANLQRSDGTSIQYYVDGAEQEGRRGLLLMLQGSGCEPVMERAWVKTEPSLLAPDYAVVTIEKYGVALGQTEGSFVDGCSADYWAKNTLQQRVLDAVQVVVRLRKEPWWSRKLIIYGGSEGGAIAAMLAPLLPETEQVVIISSGIGVPVAELIRAAVPPPVAEQISAILTDAKANPTGEKRFGGASYRWWADAADITPATALLQTDVPVLLIQGVRDQFAPVATGRAARDLFAAAGKRNLTYREYASYDHFMKDAAGIDRRPEVLRWAAYWLRRQ